MRTEEIDILRGHPRLRRARIKTEWLYTTRKYPLYWHHIAKNGGTFFKRFLYALDHDGPPARQGPVHDWDDLLVRAGNMEKNAVRDSSHAVILMRNPIHRFLSVYFDKVYTAGGKRRPGMSTEFFETTMLYQEPELSAEGHVENCLKLAEWAERNIEGVTVTKPNWHLVPQMHQLAQVHELGFRVLTVEDLHWQLGQVFSDIIPDLDGHLSVVGKSNVSRKPVRKSALQVPELKERLKAIYADDFAAFRQVRQYWRDAREACET